MFPLQGNKIYLRLPHENDADLIFAWENAQSAVEINLHKEAVSKTEVEEWIKTRHYDLDLEKELRLMICMKDNSVAGSVDLFEFDRENRRAGVGIIIEENFRTKGIATESLFLLKDYCFKKIKMNSLWCNISAVNAASINLFEKCGFELSGVKKKWNVNAESEFVDELFFQCFA
ncbi:MAG: GNAT family N-acetyltransferase [Bacteroidia bacterium]|nr:GNAT family N-acetyltransferase [Bacteroidia bacterium]